MVLCRYKPGALIPADLDRLIPADRDPFEWAEQHLRAFGSVTMVTRDRTLAVAPLVPARSGDSSCHWLQNERCQVHEISPFGCAFFDQCTQTPAEAAQRAAAAEQAIADGWFNHGLYCHLWYHLWDLGLRDCPTAQDAQVLQAELRRLDLDGTR